jgi:predicted helicase
MTILEYIADINKEFRTGRATEHSYRGYLQNLIKSIVNDVMVTNEPQRVKCGAPDYIVSKKDIAVGYIEAKDIGFKLDDKKYKEQFDRYRKSLSNLIITDYIDFWLYIDGEFITKINIAVVDNGTIKPVVDNHSAFANLIKDFCTYVGQTIKSSKKLAEMMAGKARMLSEVIEKAIIEDEADIFNHDTALLGQINAFRNILIHDISPKEFADIYAQTIAYGMFAARLHDPSLQTFTRQEAAELIPKSNPFLRKLFQYIAGYDLDVRIAWIVDGLADIFKATDVAAILKNFGKSTQTNDPIIHFYETFLSEYDPALRKARGVWYTPEPVVNFIVRAVDDILKSEFKLKDGISDISKTTIDVEVANKETDNQRSKVKKTLVKQEVNKVQILDPATGTGTFLAEIIKHVYKKFEGQEGIWSNYVENHLVPRLNGFELLMASYAMAHLKLDLLLTETGYQPTKDQRFKVYLTNSLEEHHPETGTLFATWLSAEANEANKIKRDSPVMVVLGNPPYSAESSNKGKWINKLMDDYKKEPNSTEKLREKNSKAINSDEYKFIRYAQYLIEKNGGGIIAFINPHTYLDAPIFRGMRWSLINTFDSIYILNLHGNATKKETAPDGSADSNVFDIKQGVAINIFVKNKVKSKENAKVFITSLKGKREFKYDILRTKKISEIDFSEVNLISPNFSFVPSFNIDENDYLKGFSISDLFPIKSSGIKTHNDGKLVSQSLSQLKINLELDGFEFENRKAEKYSYRPFESSYVYYDVNLIGRPREKTIYHLQKPNLGLVLVSQPQSANLNFFDCVFIVDSLVDTNMFRRGGPQVFPLFLYPRIAGQSFTDGTTKRTVNLDNRILNEISNKLRLPYSGIIQDDLSFSPINILDFVYSVLHSMNYRIKYWDFLKIDFPRIPYPTDVNKFWNLVKLGSELRQIHLLESDAVNRFITKYPINGNSVVGKLKFELNRVYINEIQYFDNVPVKVWEFFIGGYQPAQKWLKDRKGRELSFDDILHYQRIIVALNETIRIMTEIDEVGVE